MRQQRVHTIRLLDFTFDPQYFHSASLRVAIPPGGDQFDVTLMVTLFMHNGMRDFGVKCPSIEGTVLMFAKLSCLTGGPPINDREIDALVELKTDELNYYQKALREKQKQEAKDQPS